MNTRATLAWCLVLVILITAPTLGICRTQVQLRAQASKVQEKPAVSELRKLSHEETLHWIAENKAWRLATKTKPIWARPVETEEVGKEFQTADHVKEKAKAGFWLCVGVAGEPWFQSRERLEGKYEPDAQETKSFDFDTKLRTYREYKPTGTVRNWVAQVKGPGIAGFFVRPGYDQERPLYSQAGGYVVKDDVADPYRDKPKDVWLVQQSLFDSTYELVRERQTDPAPPASR
jgi:hypothetical protein